MRRAENSNDKVAKYAGHHYPHAYPHLARQKNPLQIHIRVKKTDCYIYTHNTTWRPKQDSTMGAHYYGHLGDLGLAVLIREVS